MSGPTHSIPIMRSLRFRQVVSAVLALLGWGTYFVRSSDEGQLVGEFGFFAVAVATTATISLVVWTAIPGIARVYAMGWSDRDQRCSCERKEALDFVS